MKRNRKVELVFGDGDPVGYLLDQDELEKLTADELREAVSAGGIFVIREPDGTYAVDIAMPATRPGEIKQRADGSYKVVRVEPA